MAAGNKKHEGNSAHLVIRLVAVLCGGYKPRIP